MSPNNVRTRYRVSGMDCASCSRKIDTAVRRLVGVEDVAVSVAAGTMTVTHGPDVSVADIAPLLDRLGYAAHPLAPASRPENAAPGEMAGGRDHGHDHGAGDRHHHAGPAGSASHASHASHRHDHDPGEGAWWKRPGARLTAASGAALVIAYGLGYLVPAYGTPIFVLALLVGLVPIARRAFAAAQAGTPFSIETLMTIAAVGAVIIGAAEEAAAVVFLFLVGELLEGVAAGRARNSIRALTELMPRTAHVERNGVIEEIPAADLSVGAVLIVRPGDRIAADGEILEGVSAVDEAPVTGESVPRGKEPGEQVFAGTINGQGMLRVRVTAAAEDNTISRIVRLVEEAQESKAPTERFIDRFSTWYTPGVIVVAALIAIVPPLFAEADWSEWIYKGLAILLIGCPCALVISTPAAIAAALSSGARSGLLMKGGAILEQARRITAIAFDKTGTLTQGRPVVTDVLAFARSEAEVLRLAAALEAGSSHPLALAIMAHAEVERVVVPPASGAQALGGKGVRALVEGEEIVLLSPSAAEERGVVNEDVRTRIAALNDQGKTVSVLISGAEAAGAIAMRDEPRADAKSALASLREAGVRSVMLTGDNPRTAQAIGADLGVEVHAGMMPQDKSRMVARLKGEGFFVAKVGDGINDAPALAAADIGIAMGGGTDVALETADAAILHGRVADVGNMIALSQRTMANITQNISIALGLKAVFLVTTVLGITGLWPAILADTGATVLVTLNAMRLLAWRPRERA